MGSLELESHVVLSSVLWVKGTVAQASPRAADTLPTDIPPIPPHFIFRMLLSHKHHDSLVLLQLINYHLYKLTFTF